MKQELVFRFHNLNTEKATNALMKVFTEVEVGCKKLKEAITEFERNNADESSAKSE